MTKMPVIAVILMALLSSGCALLVVGTLNIVDSVNSRLSYYRRVEELEDKKYLVEIKRYVEFTVKENEEFLTVTTFDTTFPVMEISYLDRTLMDNSTENMALRVAELTCERKPWFWGETEFAPMRKLEDGVWKFVNVCKR